MFQFSLAMAWLSFGLGTALHLLCAGLVTFHCLQNRREPASALLWIFLAWSFPVVGPFAYLTLGVDRVTEKGFARAATDRRLRAERKLREDESLPLSYWRTVHEASSACPEDRAGSLLNYAIDAVISDHPLLGGNKLEIMISGDEWYERLFEAIQEARHHIHIECFIVRNDSVGRRLLELLDKQASRGVTVRLMYDRFGSTQAVLSGLFHRFRGRRNLQIHGWTLANPLKRQFQINLRNHRKIAVIDGRKAFTGGINFSENNLSSEHIEAIRDYHFQVVGPAVQELQYTFVRDWHFMTGADPDTLLTAAYFPHIDTVGKTMVRVINSGPSDEMEVMDDVFFMAFTSARRQILAVSPYFVPPRELVAALKAAARRGVDVRLILPLKNNHYYAGMASRALYDEMMTAGVRIFEREPPFLHAKALIVDDFFSFVGSANLDMRSLRLNYETNLAVFDESFANRLKEFVLEEQQRSRELALGIWRKRPVHMRFLENLFHLMTPAL